MLLLFSLGNSPIKGLNTQSGDQVHLLSRVTHRIELIDKLLSLLLLQLGLGSDPTRTQESNEVHFPGLQLSRGGFGKCRSLGGLLNGTRCTLVVLWYGWWPSFYFITGGIAPL